MIIDDHEIVRRGIAEIVDRDDALEVVAEAGSVADAVRRADLVRQRQSRIAAYGKFKEVTA